MDRQLVGVVGYQIDFLLSKQILKTPLKTKQQIWTNGRTDRRQMLNNNGSCLCFFVCLSVCFLTLQANRGSLAKKITFILQSVILLNKRMNRQFVFISSIPLIYISYNMISQFYSVLNSKSIYEFYTLLPIHRIFEFITTCNINI